MKNNNPRQPILAGLRVLDLGHQYAAANCGAILADLGADVVSIEHPGGNAIRTMLPKKDGHSMWWKVAQRGKKYISLKLSTPQGRDIFLKMVKDFDVLIENFRPGTLEKWGLGPQELEDAGANLAMVRISGYGQTGPYRERPGFGTAAEAMSGFAHMNGFPDGPPTFPSTTLADGVASLWAVIGALATRLNKTCDPSNSGVEVIDVALFEALFRIVPTQISTLQQTGVVQMRPGNYLGDHGVLRNTYRSRDGHYYITAAVGPDTMRRVLVAAQAEELIGVIDAGIMLEDDTQTIQDFLWRCNTHLIAWSAERDFVALEADLKAAGAVYSTVYSAAEIMADPHYQARGDLVTLQDPELGPLTMQGIVPKFPARDHAIRHAGGPRGLDNEAFYARLNIGAAEIEQLKRDGVM